MKRVIRNKVYDTDTAQRLGEYAPNPYRSDFHYFCETLYRKKTGEFFLHGEGNAASKYSRSCGQNEWCGDEKIVPLTYEDAQAWAEEHLDGDEYIEIFGEPEENGSTEVLSISMPASTAAKIRQLAGQEGKTLSAFIVDKALK